MKPASFRKKFAAKIKEWKYERKRAWALVDKADFRQLAEFLVKKAGARLATATGFDEGQSFLVMYHFSLDSTGDFITLRYRIPKKNPVGVSISDITSAAKWIEREMMDLLGIGFEGHPDKRRLILPDDASKGEHPLRQGGGR